LHVSSLVTPNFVGESQLAHVRDHSGELYALELSLAGDDFESLIYYLRETEVLIVKFERVA